MTSSRHSPYVLGNTRATMVSTTGSQVVIRSQSLKTDLSSDCRLQLACMKLESLVNVGQHTALNTFSGLVHTACQLLEVGCTRSPM